MHSIVSYLKRSLGKAGLICVVALVLAGALASWPKHAARGPDKPLEILRSSLVLQDGRLYLPVNSNAFTGVMIERYADGALMSRSEISNGVLHGISEGWYTNGQTQITEHFKGGLSHGLRTKWYPSGSKLSEATIVEGKFAGTLRKWHENGTLSEEVAFNEGQPQGVSLAWFSSGHLKARARLDSGKVLEQKFWKDGESEQTGAELDPVH